MKAKYGWCAFFVFLAGVVFFGFLNLEPQLCPNFNSAPWWIQIPAAGLFLYSVVKWADS
jgi:hypothetical protein